MKVLFLCSEQYVHWEWEPLYHEILKPIIQCEIHPIWDEIVYQRILRQEGKEVAGEKVLLQVREFSPDVVVYITTWPHECLHPSVLKEIMNRGVPVICVVGDTHIIPEKHEEGWFQSCSVFAIGDSWTNYSKYQARSGVFPKVIFTGGNNVTEEFSPNPNLLLCYDVTSLGSREGVRVQLVAAVRAKLKEQGFELHEAGGLVDQTASKDRGRLTGNWISWEGYIRTILTSKVMLVTQTDPKRSQLKGKVFQALACGTCVLCDRNKEVEAVIPKDCVATYGSEEECVAQALDLLRNPIRRQKIATTGHQWFKETYNYKKFWSEVLQTAVQSMKKGA